MSTRANRAWFPMDLCPISFISQQIINPARDNISCGWSGATSVLIAQPICSCSRLVRMCVLTVCLASTTQYIYFAFLKRLNTVWGNGGTGQKAERYFLATAQFNKWFLPVLSILLTRNEWSFRLLSLHIGQTGCDFFFLYESMLKLRKC